MLQKRCMSAFPSSLRTASDCLANSVLSTCVSHATRILMHGIPPCSITSRSFTKSGLALCSWTPPKFLRCFDACKSSTLFDFFDFFNLPTTVAHSLPSYQLMLNRPMLVASKTPSAAPKALYTSDFHCRCRRYRCRPILTSRDENLGNPGTPHLHLFHQQHVNMATRAMQDLIGQWM